MQVNKDTSIRLTSTAVVPNSKGFYPFNVIGFLMPHEMIRRELKRGQVAIQDLEFHLKTWKAKAFKEWIIDFLLPMIQTHHYIEDNIIFPFYLSLGCVPPDDGTSDDHVTLLGRVNRVKIAVEKLVKYVEEPHIDQHTEEKKRIRDQVETLKHEYEDMLKHIQEHFDEEEQVWPPMFSRCGEGNWAKVENLIIDHTLQFGETNAGEPYRLMTCAMARAMGITIGKDNEFSGNETRWCSTDIQANYINTFPYLVRNYKIIQWNKRYLEYKDLVESLRSSSTNTTEPIVHSETGKFVEKNQKTFVPLVLFLCFCGYFSLIVSPLYASVSNPDRNVKRLQIKVTNYDRSSMLSTSGSSSSSGSTDNSVGTAFINYVTSYKAAHDGSIPDLQFVDSQSASPGKLKNQVLDLEAWAAVYVNEDATSSLLSALSDGCSTSSTSGYNSKDAITFVWDESRNSGVSGPYIASFLRTLITDFGIEYEKQLMANLSSTTTSQGDNALLSCLAKGQTDSTTESLISQPVLYTEINLTPTSVSPTFNSVGVTDGSIYVAVFGANYVVGSTYSNTAALAEDMSPLGKVMLRSGTISALCLGMSICFSTIMIGLTADGSSGVLFGGLCWIRICALQWMHQMIWAFGHAWELESGGAMFLPFLSACLLWYSICGGWNTDLADPGYKEFFQIFPFNWSTNLFRYEIFGSCRTLVATSAGVLMLYWAVFVGGYLYTASKNELRKVSNKQYVESKYAAPASTASSPANATNKKSSSTIKSDNKLTARPAVQNRVNVKEESDDDDDEEEGDEEQGKAMDTKSWAEKQKEEQARRDALIKSYEAVYEENEEHDSDGKEKEKQVRSASETALTASVGESMI